MKVAIVVLLVMVCSARTDPPSVSEVQRKAKATLALALALEETRQPARLVKDCPCSNLCCCGCNNRQECSCGNPRIQVKQANELIHTITTPQNDAGRRFWIGNSYRQQVIPVRRGGGS